LYLHSIDHAHPVLAATDLFRFRVRHALQRLAGPCGIRHLHPRFHSALPVNNRANFRLLRDRLQPRRVPPCPLLRRPLREKQQEEQACGLVSDRTGFTPLALENLGNVRQTLALSPIRSLGAWLGACHLSVSWPGRSGSGNRPVASQSESAPQPLSWLGRFE